MTDVSTVQNMHHDGKGTVRGHIGNRTNNQEAERSVLSDRLGYAPFIFQAVGKSLDRPHVASLRTV